MDTSLKRIIAFVIDIVIVSLVVSLINLLPLDPYKDKYKDAYEKYGSWTTVAASYNAGMGRISTELEKQLADRSFDLLIVVCFLQQH